MDELQPTFPRGIRYAIPFDTTPFVSASIKEVAITLVEAMVLVTLVVFLFLQSWRATLIPMLAVPVSVIGTFLGLLTFGMSINVLTLFGLVLAIGIVVDDAIVVIENVERIMATEGLPPRLAADKAIRQVGSALVAIVLVLCSVFVPVAFIGGVTGAFFKQFAMTIVIAVVLSGLVALTLTPGALRAAPQGHERDAHDGLLRLVQSRLRSRDEPIMSALSTRYSVDRRRGSARSRCFIALAGLLWTRIPTAFIPTEDKGYMAMSIQLPDAASLQRTEAVVANVEKIIRTEPAVQNIVALVGLDLLSQSNSTNGATVFLNLKPWEERSKHDALDSIATRINGKLFAMKDAMAFGFNLPEVPGLGVTAGVEVNLQNRQRAGYSRVRRTRERVPPVGEPAVGVGRAQLDVPRERAAGVRHGRSHRRQGARREPHGPVRDAAGVSLVAVHQRLQSVRQDVPRAGERGRGVPAVA